MKIKINDKVLKDVEAEFRLRANKLIKSPALLSELADVAIKDIKFQARRGMSTTGERFKKLSSKWIQERENISKSTATHDAFEPRKSNITITGKLLDSMSKMITKTGIRIYFSGKHLPYRAKYLEYFSRKKQKRTVRLAGILKGFQKSHGGIEYVNTGRKGYRTIGKPIDNAELAQHVGKLRPFFKIRESLTVQLKNIVIRYIRRKL